MSAPLNVKEFIDGTLISKLTSEQQAKRGWEVVLNGEVVKDVSSLIIRNPNFGIVGYGMTEAGYDGWAFREKKGSAVVVPWSRRKSDGMILIGLVEEMRHNFGGIGWGCPGGFANRNESHEEAANRELSEEFGPELAKRRIARLPGGLLNSNRAFFETPDPDQGVAPFHLEIPEDMLVLQAPNEYGLRDKGLFKPTNKAIEKFFSSKFVPWPQVAMGRDAIISACVFRLMALLQG